MSEFDNVVKILAQPLFVHIMSRIPLSYISMINYDHAFILF